MNLYPPTLLVINIGNSLYQETTPLLPPSLPPLPQVDNPSRHQLVPATLVIVLFDLTNKVIISTGWSFKLC